jgi:hypothetical protein
LHSGFDLSANNRFGDPRVLLLVYSLRTGCQIGEAQSLAKQRKHLALSVLCLGIGTAMSGAADFYPPIRLKAGDAAIRVESPGYAAPCWANFNGKTHLLVGQFNGGKIHAFEHLRAEMFAPGQWLQAGGKVAEVPGLW